MDKQQIVRIGVLVRRITLPAPHRVDVVHPGLDTVQVPAAEFFSEVRHKAVPQRVQYPGCLLAISIFHPGFTDLTINLI